MRDDYNYFQINFKITAPLKHLIEISIFVYDINIWALAISICIYIYDKNI